MQARGSLDEEETEMDELDDEEEDDALLDIWEEWASPAIIRNSNTVNFILLNPGSNYPRIYRIR